VDRDERAEAGVAGAGKGLRGGRTPHRCRHRRRFAVRGQFDQRSVSGVSETNGNRPRNNEARDACSINVRAIPARQILEEPGTSFHAHLGVAARHPWVITTNISDGVAAEQARSLGRHGQLERTVPNEKLVQPELSPRSMHPTAAMQLAP
jgi:hypothetical protein